MLEGEGLLGDPTFGLQGTQTSIYEVLFTPLRAFKGKGSIAFINDKLGEI